MKLDPGFHGPGIQFSTILMFLLHYCNSMIHHLTPFALVITLVILKKNFFDKISLNFTDETNIPQIGYMSKFQWRCCLKILKPVKAVMDSTRLPNIYFHQRGIWHALQLTYCGLLCCSNATWEFVISSEISEI